MKALVTGSTGFIGRNLVEELKRQGYGVFEHTRANGHTVKNLQEIVWGFRPDQIFHLAGELRNEEAMFDSNVVFTQNLLMATRDYPYWSMVYTGSSTEYGRRIKPLEETDPVNPTNTYEATKAAGTMLCLAEARSHEKPVSVIRPFSVYGKYEAASRFIPTIYRKAIAGDTVKIYRGYHDFIYVKDFIRGTLAVAANPRYGDVINLGTGVQVANEDVVKTFEKILNRGIAKDFVNEYLRPYDSNYWVCDCRHANDVYNFMAKYDLEAGLRDCYI